jgi:hypothetical protein
MAHRSPPSQPSGDDVSRPRDVDPADLMPEEALAQTDVDLSADMGQFEDQRASRLAADRRLVQVLAKDNFEGERFDKLARKLYGYAWPIVMGWTGTGRIFKECEKYRRPVRRPEAASGWTYDDRHQITTDTCLEGVEFFRDYALRKSKWDPRRGAGIASYFVGSCVCCFPEVFEDWWKEQQVAETLRIAVQETDDPQDSGVKYLVADREPDPAMVAVTRDEAARAMRQVTDPQLRHVLWGRAIGLTQAEAAEEVGLTPKAAERRLARHRDKVLDAPADPVDPGDGRTGSL